jgi:hypothetical protein
MSIQSLLKFGILAVGMVSTLTAATFTVSQDGRGQFTSVQKAVDAARAGDEVVILDFSTYKEQVTIDSTKNRLTLRSENPQLRNKPTISFLDNINQGPRNYEESQDQTKITFDQNGGVRIMRTRGVTIDGIILDGGKPSPFAWAGVWEQRYPLFHGNAALTLYVAGDVVVRNCEIQNSYYGIYIKDRNEGGIYANANPADLQPQLVVPLSGFGKTGNHLFEQNRIHNNSWGMYFESVWDFSSTVRYNLFFDNHQTEELALSVPKMPDGGNQHGGAIIFKDLLLSPIAIYNNTFYHNNLIVCADWQVGAQHLFFNNIYGTPYNEKVVASHQALDVAMPNRIFNSLYATQEGQLQTRSQEYNAGMSDPETNQYVEGRMTHKGIGYVSVLNGFPQMKPTVQVVDLEIPLFSGPVTRPITVDWEILPGTIISTAAVNEPFPASAGNRWLETGFTSTDPDDPDFLTPDWNDSTIAALVVDRGWAGAGNRDADGSVADIGAIPMGGIPETEMMLTPIDPVFITGTNAKVKFDLTPLAGSMNNPKVKYVKWIKDVPYLADSWGVSDDAVIAASDIVNVQIPSTRLVIGSNILNFTIPPMSASYGFFDVVVEGTTAEGAPITTNVGFLPYRKIDYIFEVVVMDAAGTQKITTVKAGEPVQLWITPKRLDGKSFDAKIDKVDVSLSSNFNLLTPSGQVFKLPGGLQGTTKSQVVFTKVPAGGVEGVSVSGMFTNPNDPKVFFAIFGSSEDIRVLPGPPEKIAFQKPPSNGVLVVDPGTSQAVEVQAFDNYDNKIDTTTGISLVSTAKEIGDVVESPVTTNDTGLAVFRVMVNKGNLNDTFPVVATLTVNNATDRAKIVVGKPRDKFWIFYDDVGVFNPQAGIEGCSGTRVPVTIWASQDGTTPIATQTAEFTVELSGGLAVYATASPDDTAKLIKAKLEAGVRQVWIKATSKNVTNGMISVYAIDGTIRNAVRENIYFTSCNSTVKRAAYFSSDGKGSVDRAEIYFEKPLQTTEIPDSMRFFWPNRAGEERLVRKAELTVDSSDSSHLTVLFKEPFSEGVTKYTGSNGELGEFYWWNSLTPDVSSQTFGFAIADSVGPLLASAMVVERLSPGVDTLYISFTEGVMYDVVAGKSLVLIKNGTRIPLSVIASLPQMGTLVVKAVCGDMGENAPVEGDSLMVAADGPIVDQFNNHAHIRNRPVVIELRQVPADIIAAWYADLNADGKVDHVTITFNKKVNLSQIEVSLVWSGKTITVTNDQQLFSWADETQTVITVDVSTLVTTTATYGIMPVHVFFTSFTEGNQRSFTAADKAAPVLDTVTYYYERELPGGVVSDVVSFKLDDLSGMVLTGETMPLRFSSSGGEYTVILQFLNRDKDEFVYRVKSVTDADGSTVVPLKGDLVWISTEGAIVSDAQDPVNVQQNEDNRKVLLAIKLPELKTEVTYGPNPFFAGGAGLDGVFRLRVQPKTNLTFVMTIKGTMSIYDKVGNRVKRFPVTSASKILELQWDGTNERGRKVGAGTYIAMFEHSVIINESEDIKKPQKIKIGVR